MLEYLRAQMETATGSREKFTLTNVGSTKVDQESTSAASKIGSISEHQNANGTDGTNKSHPSERFPVPRTIVKFQKQEPELLTQCCKKVIVSPRATKRLSNVFKLLKIIWNRRGLDQGPSDDVKLLMLMLLTLIARYPEIMGALMRNLEEEYRRHPDEAAKSDLISEFLESRCQEKKTTASRSADWDRVEKLIADAGIFPPLSFSEVGVENIMLVSSFSFFGEIAPERKVEFSVPQ